MIILKQLQNMSAEYEGIWKEVIKKEGYARAKKLYISHKRRCGIVSNVCGLAVLILNGFFLHESLISLLCISTLAFGNIYFLLMGYRGWDFDLYYGSEQDSNILEKSIEETRHKE